LWSLQICGQPYRFLDDEQACEFLTSGNPQKSDGFRGSSHEACLLRRGKTHSQLPSAKLFPDNSQFTGDDYHEDQLLGEMAFFGLSGDAAHHSVSYVG
jgi:hypothetical protein